MSSANQTGNPVYKIRSKSTGFMHVGNLRTALYEYLIAKSLGAHLCFGSRIPIRRGSWKVLLRRFTARFRQPV